MEWTDLDLLLKLLFSHLVVDFLLQTNSIVRKKKEGNCLYHVIHSLTQALVAYLIVGLWNCMVYHTGYFCYSFCYRLLENNIQRETLFFHYRSNIAHYCTFYSMDSHYRTIQHDRGIMSGINEMQ